MSDDPIYVTMSEDDDGNLTGGGDMVIRPEGEGVEIDVPIVCGRCADAGKGRKIAAIAYRDYPNAINLKIYSETVHKGALTPNDVEARVTEPSGGRWSWGFLLDPDHYADWPDHIDMTPRCEHSPIDVDVARLMAAIRAFPETEWEEIQIR